MRSLETSFCSVSIVVVSFVFGAVVPAAAQTPGASSPDGGVNWSLYDAVGYGGLGFGLGLMSVWDLEGSGFGPPDAALVVIGATTVAGIVGGAVLGGRAERAAAAGRQVSGPHRAAVLSGAAFAGGTLGALAAIPIINGEGEGTPFGSDERTVMLFVLSGGAFGALFAWHHRADLSPERVSLSPAPSEHGGYGLRVRLGF